MYVYLFHTLHLRDGRTKVLIIADGGGEAKGRGSESYKLMIFQ